MSSTRVVDQQRSALRHTRPSQTAALRRPRDLAQLKREPVSNRSACSVQAELEALCSNWLLMLDLRTSSPGPRFVPDPRAERTRTDLQFDARHRAPRDEPLARI